MWDDKNIMRISPRFVGPLLALVPALAIAQTNQPPMPPHPGFTPVRMVKGREAKAVNGWKNQLGTVVQSSPQHCLILEFKHVAQYEPNGESSSDGSSGGGGGGGGDPFGGPMSIGGPGGDPGGGPGGDPGGGGGGGGIPGHYSIHESAWIEIVSPLQFGAIPAGRTITPVGQTRLRMKINRGDSFEVLYPGPDILPSGQGLVRIELPDAVYDNTFHRWYWTYDPKTYTETTYNFTKRTISSDASISTRKGYGQPNREGQVKADPNSDLRNFNFNTWDHKGGLYVGNVPSSTGDRSGAARLQLWTGIQSNEPQPVMSILSLLGLGSPSIANQDQTVGLFLPAASDPNINVPPSAATWGNRWDIVPRSAPTDPLNPDYTRDPFRKRVLNSGLANDYVCFSLTTAKDVWKSDLLLYDRYETEQVTLLDRVGRLVLAPHDEAAWLAGSPSSWKYFASLEFASLAHTVYPQTDCTPRLWWITVASKTEGTISIWP